MITGALKLKTAGMTFWKKEEVSFVLEKNQGYH